MPSLQVDLFSQTPPWFFSNSLEGPYEYHDLATDVGLVQATPLTENLPATIESLDEFLPFNENRVLQLALQLQQSRCRLIVCDISPLGIAVAEQAGIPSVLIENFTWDWIYEGYAAFQTQLAKYNQILKNTFAKVTFRIQVEPNCAPQAADLLTGPVSRRPKRSRQEIRRDLNIPDQKKLVLITMGGIPDSYRFLDQLHTYDDCCFLVPCAHKEMERDDNVVLLPYHSAFFHPDLVHAADAVVGKVGYSTLAEVYHAGIPFGYFTRPGFRESAVLSAFIQQKMQGIEMQISEYGDGSWIGRLPALLRLPVCERSAVNGADRVAAFLKNLITRQGGRTP